MMPLKTRLPFMSSGRLAKQRDAETVCWSPTELEKKRHYSDKISNSVSSDFHLSLAIKNFKRHVALRD